MTLFNTDKHPPDFLDNELAAAGSDSRENRLRVIADHARRCLRCGLHRTRNHAVPGEGEPNAGIFIVGEAPGRNEDAAGRPFVGPSGKKLDEMLGKASMSREEVFITNLVKCRPVKVAHGKLANRAPARIEISACRPYLAHQIQLIEPEIILCLGSVSAQELINRSFDIASGHGKFHQSPCGAVIMATFHPAYVLRGGAGAPTAKIEKLVAEDMEKLRSLSH